MSSAPTSSKTTRRLALSFSKMEVVGKLAREVFELRIGEPIKWEIRSATLVSGTVPS